VPDHATAAPSPPGTHAVVVGAGAAGRSAALALADRTERITLIDRADVPGPEWEARPRPADVRAVLESPQVVVRAGLEVVGLVLRDDGDGIRVGGVLVCSRRAGGAVTELGADLVVDARGPVAVPVSVAVAPARRGRGRDRPRPAGGSVTTPWPARAG
jgi:glycine/D-amino acid oxidase-like deaminating enzyme